MAAFTGQLRGTRRNADAPVADLSPALLRDIGVARRDYRGATGRAAWHAPDHWFEDPSRD